MIRQFLETLTPDLNAKTLLRNLYKRFKTTPKVESVRYANFLGQLGRAGVTVEGKYLIGYKLPSDPTTTDRPGVLPPKKTTTEDAIKLCAKCGKIIHPCYWLGSGAGSRCEDCLADIWWELHIHGTRNEWTAWRKVYGGDNPKRKPAFGKRTKAA